MSTPTVIVLTLGLDELRALVGDEVAKRISAIGSVATAEGLISKGDLAAKLDCSTAKVDRLCLDGMPFVVVGDTRRFMYSEVLEWLKSRQSVLTAQPKRASENDAAPADGVRLLTRGSR